MLVLNASVTNNKTQILNHKNELCSLVVIEAKLHKERQTAKQWLITMS